jgi:hypothetical protein
MASIDFIDVTWLKAGQQSLERSATIETTHALNTSG